ncbi:hypothetical protein [Prochlorococcus marinus]|uniref:hypothetical protein n=1 Tax=Prochlorococcus marinus TaxID=1219 RepID=UPI001F43A17A|nr:hypothetical protein [Prochlorococcus marinus]
MLDDTLPDKVQRPYRKRVSRCLQQVRHVEEVKVKLQGLRKALRVMHAGVLEETVLPEPGDV